MRRILLVLSVVALMAATVFSAPTAFAQNDPSTSAKHFFACYKGKTYDLNSKKQRRHFIKTHNGATKGRCR